MSEFKVEMAHSADFWDERYGGSDPVWSGRVNTRLVEHSAHLNPGSALDIGCGEGGDAAWLAQRGWQVLAVDVSSVALGKAQEGAEAELESDVAGRITWQQADIRTWQPPAAAFDLVSMQFLHLPRATLIEVQARLAAAVRTGGELLIVNHDQLDLHTSAGRPHAPELFLSAEEIVATLDSGSWRIEAAGAFPRPFTDPDGRSITIHDAVVRAARVGGAKFSRRSGG